MPCETTGDKKVIKLGGTSVELLYLGPNHSDSNLVIRLPKEKIVFIVDTIPVGSFPGRGMIDFFPLETEAFITKVPALDWDRLIPGHPGQPNGRLQRRVAWRRFARIVRSRIFRVRAGVWGPSEWQNRPPTAARSIGGPTAQ